MDKQHKAFINYVHRLNKDELYKLIEEVNKNKLDKQLTIDDYFKIINKDGEND